MVTKILQHPSACKYKH